MLYKSLAVVMLAAAALAICVAPASAGDPELMRLGGGSATTLALGTDVQADTVAVGRWGGCGVGRSFCGPRFCGGGFCGARFSSGFCGPRLCGSFCGPRFWGGGFCGPRFSSGFCGSSFCAPRWTSCWRPFGFCGVSSWGIGLGWSQPFCSSFWGGPTFSNSTAFFPITSTVISPSVGTTAITPPGTVFNSAPNLPPPIISGYGPSTPALPPGQPGTFPYDGGPSAPVPMPRREAAPPPQPQPAPMSVPPRLQREDRMISLPRSTPKYSYPAYGDTQKRPR